MFPFCLVKFSYFKIVIPTQTRQVLPNIFPDKHTMCIFLHICEGCRPSGTAGKVGYQIPARLFGSGEEHPTRLRIKFPVQCVDEIYFLILTLFCREPCGIVRILNTDSNKAHHIYMIITSAVAQSVPAHQHFYNMFCEDHEAWLKIILWTHAITNQTSQPYGNSRENNKYPRDQTVLFSFLVFSNALPPTPKFIKDDSWAEVCKSKKLSRTPSGCVD